MLEIDYPTRFGELIASRECEIELPSEWTGYFDERGEITAYLSDERSNSRLKIRTEGLMWFEHTLPFRPREALMTRVYTKDFSRCGLGFLTPFELYPEECVRIVLSTFWLDVQVVRARRITSKCYEIGTKLLGRYEPSMDAFDLHGDPVAV